MRILRMVEEGKITSEQAAQLIAALGGAAPAAPAQEAGLLTGRSVRITVTDTSSGRNRVNIRVPARLLDWALRLGLRFAPEKGPALEDIADAIDAGEVGRVFEVVDASSGTRTEVFIE
jgi:hypothetical protein